MHRRILFLCGVWVVCANCGAEEHELDVGYRFTTRGRQAMVVEYDVLSCRETPFSRLCAWERYENPVLRRLREQYRLDEVVLVGKSEFEKQVLLLEWVHTSFQYGEPVREVSQGRFSYLGELRDALAILSLAKKEQQFFCIQYAAVLMAAASALGWVCRPVGMPEDTWTEVWSNQYGRWVKLVPLKGSYVTKGGIPVDTLTAVRALKSGSRGLMRVFCDGTRVPLHCPQAAECSLKELFYSSSCNWQETGKDGGRKYWIDLDKRKGGFPPAGLDRDDFSDDVLFPVNQASLTFAAHQDGLLVTIRTLTPNFKRYLVRVGGGQWENCGDHFVWVLHPGENILEARVENLFGVLGYPSKVRIQVSQ